jgi:hypothetical protein
LTGFLHLKRVLLAFVLTFPLADSDDNARMVAVPYEKSRPKAGSAVDLRPTLTTVSGSTAGAGSMTYNRHRRHHHIEAERIRGMEADAREAELDDAFQLRSDREQAKLEGQTRRKADRRSRKRGRKALAKQLSKAGKATSEEPSAAAAAASSESETPAGAAAAAGVDEEAVAAMMRAMLEEEAAADPELASALAAAADTPSHAAADPEAAALPEDVSSSKRTKPAADLAM